MVQHSPANLIRKYYDSNPHAHQLLLDHSRLVTKKALSVARQLQEPVDVNFIAEAAMLHDIGIIFTRAPDLYCYGDLPYLTHGVKGCEILQLEGLPRHARVCERHTGVGLTAKEIVEQRLPLPVRDMLPETLEEKIICYADLFFSKNSRDRGREKSLTEVRQGLLSYGAEKGVILDSWHECFNPATKKSSP